MKLIPQLSRAAGLGLCVVAFSGTALADPGNGNGNGPEATPPGQEQKAETPAATAPAQAPAQSAQGQDNKAENQQKQAAKKAAAAPAPKPAKAKTKADKPAKTSGTYKNTSSGTDRKKNVVGGHKHTICHATGSASNPYVRITPSVSGVFHGHMDHQDDRDIVPPYTYKGVSYSQNWDAAGQAIFDAGCDTSASTTPTVNEHDNEHGKVLICHRTGSATNPYVVINIARAGWDNGHSKHDGDKLIRENVAPGEKPNASDLAFAAANCVTAAAGPPTPPSSSGSLNTSNTSAVAGGQAPAAQAPVGGVAGAVSPAPAAKKESAGGVLGAVASAPEAIADTATGTLPFTGFPVWMAALIGVALLLAGLTLRRRNAISQ